MKERSVLFGGLIRFFVFVGICGILCISCKQTSKEKELEKSEQTQDEKTYKITVNNVEHGSISVALKGNGGGVYQF